MQSPANPQCFNRYTYCLNNPLKYIDPSGHRVIIGGTDITELEAAVNSCNYMWFMQPGHRGILEETELLVAYGTLRSTAPELTGYVESVEAEVILATVPYGIGEYIGGSNGGPVLINENSFGSFSNETIAGVLGHELFHAAIEIGTGCEDKFAADEVFAFSIQYQIADKLGCLDETDNWFGVSNFANFNPYMDSNTLNKMLPDASQFLYDNYGYSEPHWIFWSKPMQSWSNDDTNGDKFLTVAQDVWVN